MLMLHRSDDMNIPLDSPHSKAARSSRDVLLFAAFYNGPASEIAIDSPARFAGV